jgi:hypothetical protein
MTYDQLKTFCNSLTPEQLQQEVYLAQVDDSAIKVESAFITDKDQYFDHTDGLGTLEEIKEEYPTEWEDVIADATICPKGTVMLCNE